MWKWRDPGSFKLGPAEVPSSTIYNHPHHILTLDYLISRFLQWAPCIRCLLFKREEMSYHCLKIFLQELFWKTEILLCHELFHGHGNWSRALVKIGPYDIYFEDLYHVTLRMIVFFTLLKMIVEKSYSKCLTVWILMWWFVKTNMKNWKSHAVVYLGSTCCMQIIFPCLS